MLLVTTSATFLLRALGLPLIIASLAVGEAVSM